MSGPGTLAAIAGLVLVPFGNLPRLLKSQNPWHGFDAQDPHLVVARAQLVKGPKCVAWIKALAQDRPGTAWAIGPAPGGTSLNPALHAWDPLKAEDLDDIRECDEQPCRIKLGDAEVEEMKASREAGRQYKFKELIQARVAAYLKTQERKGYEFPGAPADPWSYLEKGGFRTQLKRPQDPAVFARKLDFAPGKARILHQLVDWRFASAPREAVSWLRDIYDDHYFDSWGEWTQIHCEPDGGVRVVQALFLEFDLLKQNDVLSRMMRGKMKGAVQSQGAAYLDRSFEQLKAAAGS